MPPYDLSIEGWMTEPELRWLHDTAAGMSSVVEVGSFRGRSAYALLQGCRGDVYCIDPWGDVLNNGTDNLALFLANIGTRVSLADWRRLHVLRMSSLEGAAWFRTDGEAADMVFVDGDHYRPAFSQDLEVWTPKARRLICGHDYHNDAWGDVTAVVHEVFGERVQNPAGMIWSVEI